MDPDRAERIRANRASFYYSLRTDFLSTPQLLEERTHHMQALTTLTDPHPIMRDLFHTFRRCHRLESLSTFLNQSLQPNLELSTHSPAAQFFRDSVAKIIRINHRLQVLSMREAREIPAGPTPIWWSRRQPSGVHEPP